MCTTTLAVKPLHESSDAMPVAVVYPSATVTATLLILCIPNFVSPITMIAVLQCFPLQLLFTGSSRPYFLATTYIVPESNGTNVIIGMMTVSIGFIYKYTFSRCSIASSSSKSFTRMVGKWTHYFVWSKRTSTSLSTVARNTSELFLFAFSTLINSHSNYFSTNGTFQEDFLNCSFKLRKSKRVVWRWTVIVTEKTLKFKAINDVYGQDIENQRDRA